MNTNVGEWFGVYLFNLREPMAIGVLFGLAACVAIGVWSAGVRQRSKFGEPEYVDAKWRHHMSLQCGVVLAFLGIAVWAIPSPTYNVRYVDRPIKQIVRVPVKVYSGIREVPSNYQNVYDSCIDSYSGHVYDSTLEICHKQAIEAVKATQPSPAVITKVVVRYNSFEQLYKTCIGEWGITDSDKAVGISPAMIRNQRIQICTNAALQGSRAH